MKRPWATVVGMCAGSNAYLVWIRVTALVLLAAGCAKLFSPTATHTAPPWPVAWLQPPPHALGTAELLLAIVVLGASCTRWARASAAVLIVTLLLFTGWNVAQSSLWGRSDCGCWGSIAVSPRIMASLDAILAALLMGTSVRRTSWLAALPCGWLAFVLSWAVADYGWSVYETKHRAAQLSLWLGRPFRPLYELGEAGTALLYGRWLVMLYDNQCGRCQAQLTRFAATNPLPHGIRKAVLCMGPCPKPADASDDASALVWVDAATSNTLRRVTTPQYFLLENGRVQDLSPQLHLLLERQLPGRPVLADSLPPQKGGPR